MTPTVEEIVKGLSEADRGIYNYAAMVSRSEPGQTTMSLVQGYMIAANEDEARGVAVKRAAELKAGFSIDEVLILRISDAALAEVVRTYLESMGDGNG